MAPREFAEPQVQRVHMHVARRFDDDGTDVVIVLVVVLVVVMVVMMIMVVPVTVVMGRPHALLCGPPDESEHRLHVDPGVFGAHDLGERIESAKTRLRLVEPQGGPPVDLVEDE